MKNLLLVFAAIITLASCNKQASDQLATSANESSSVVKPKEKENYVVDVATGKMRLVSVENADIEKRLTATERNFIAEKSAAVKEFLLAQKRKNNVLADAGTPIAIDLINNGDGSYSWVYAALAPGDLIIWTFFRWGSTLSTTSGNVIPEGSVSYYYPNTATTTYTPPGAIFKQVVSVTGDFSLDANGVVGAGWAVSYSDVEN